MLAGKALQEVLVWASYGRHLHVRKSCKSSAQPVAVHSRSQVSFATLHADYGFVLSPNQTPYRDMYFLEKLLGLGADDGVAVNTVFTRLCWLMGVWPAVYASLLLPTAKSGNKVCAACILHCTLQCILHAKHDAM